MLPNNHPEESTDTYWQTLDTLKFNHRKIFLKQQHIDRTVETFKFLKTSIYPNITFSNFIINYFLKNISTQFLYFANTNNYSIIDKIKLTSNKSFNELSGFQLAHELIHSIYDELENIYQLQLNNKQCLKIKFNPFKIEIRFIPELPKAITLKFYKNDTLNSIDSIYTEIDNLSLASIKENFKWNQRDFWNQLLLNKPPSINDYLISNNQGFITETCFFNVFLLDKKLKLAYTPSLNSGCLNGVFRRFILKKKILEIDGIGNIPIAEKNILISDIHKYEIYVGNSLRGLLPTHIC